jgi:hypothetical protein
VNGHSEYRISNTEPQNHEGTARPPYILRTGSLLLQLEYDRDQYHQGGQSEYYYQDGESIRV